MTSVQITGFVIAPALLAFVALLAMLSSSTNTGEVGSYLALASGIIGLLERLIRLVRTIIRGRVARIGWRLVTFYALLIVVGIVVSSQTQRISIATVSGQTCGSSRRTVCKVGYENAIQGSYEKVGSSKAYVVVKPDMDLWYIQYPAPVMPQGPNSWTGKAFLGTPDSGVGRTFEVFAILTSDEYTAEQRLDSEPKGVKSNRVYCTRTR